MPGIHVLFYSGIAAGYATESCPAGSEKKTRKMSS